MLTLTLRTDKTEAEAGLYIDGEQAVLKKWEAHRELSTTLHRTIETLLEQTEKNWADIDTIVVFKGPGSFTGLRIGLTVGNTLAFSLGISIVSTTGDDWIETGLSRLKAGDNEVVAFPEYGAEANISQPRK